MDLESRRAVTPTTGVVAGSVWENRMKEVRGGIQVFNSDETPDDKTGDPSSKTELLVYKRMRAKHGLAGIGGKRKTWKTEGSEGPDKHTIQFAGQVSELEKNFDEDKCNKLSGNVDDDDDEIKKSPIQTPRMRSKWTKNLDEHGKELSVADIKKSPIQTHKTRSDKGCCDGIERSPRSLRTRSQKGVNVTNVGNERNSVQLRKLNSDSNNKPLVESSDIEKSKDEERKDNKVLVESFTSCDYTNRRKSVELFRKSNEVVSQSIKSVDGSAITVRPVGNTSTRLDNILEVKKYKEKVVTGNSSNLSQMKSLTNLEDDDENEYSDDDEIETETKDLDVKIISKPEQKDDKIVTADDAIQKSNVKSIPISTTVKRQPPVVFNKPKNVPKPTRTRPIPHGDQFKTVPNKHSKLQSVVDLVMWRDPSKSAFIFGLGTFIIMSTSYTTDINLSLISVLSYVGLVYLAAIFLFRSILSRGAIDVDNTSQEYVDRGAIDVDNTSQEYVVGEEEAVRLLKLILPYINEFLSNIKALFSGDPATTMKLAVLLYVLASCGSSITLWKMAKLGFFGVFTVPKICSSYSSQLAAYSKFWIGRFRDAWESCSHKKGVGFIVFTVVWNFSSIVARIWAVFMLFVAFRYYQQQHSEERIEVESRDASVDIRKIKTSSK